MYRYSHFRIHDHAVTSSLNNTSSKEIFCGSLALPRKHGSFLPPPKKYFFSLAGEWPKLFRENNFNYENKDCMMTPSF